ncbi:molybdenum cofactor biosynthesis protein MoaE [Ectothiorhodospira lacustris]|uniref:molybdenum cofactor biosynthesis protein MoaE n=1 Tax=Ectothiorhodospira lacustris TaxID=2899127 RepID=UPI001EE7FC8B|nr:molybdenum cofactor biosynthesis protein MoaE [Ectothiorhodospira lacustris]MCG5510830.1 molybdenum cofactor biosynthesis protein MoaE [Ectothiorhodospira lacustris]MCG5522624.1 molybdenum cofactor biosynthesis protein MoaE [Ectothiorhodospira lacustris]
MAVHLFADALDPWGTLIRHQQALTAGQFGATAVFVGTMRDFNEGDDVQAMTLEHYPGMTERQLEAIEQEAREQWPLEDVLIAHRVGRVHPGDPIVLTAVWSAHRQAAFESCRFLMEALKSRAPFWKQERLQSGQNRWVKSSTPGM